MDEELKKNWNQGHSKANESYNKHRRITVDPITRLEGHGKIDIFLDEEGDVEKAYFQVPELRGFETFCQGRPVEEMPQITSRICGVCPTAHHMAATRALDDMFKVEPTLPAKLIRELVYNAFMLEDHALHVYILGGPDFIVGPDAPKEMRNVLGVVEKAGLEVGRQVINMRKKLRDLITHLGGKVIHPVLGLPGGVAKGLSKEKLAEFKQLSQDAVDFSMNTLDVFRNLVLNNSGYLEMIQSKTYTHETYYMGMVDEKKQVNFYEGKVRVVNPLGEEYALFEGKDYLDYIAEHVEPWSFVKFCYLKPLGWKGFEDGIHSGLYAVAPMARLNVSDSMATPKSQEAREEYFELLGKPVHHTLANHWARVVEMIYAAERIQELLNHPEITSTDLRNIPSETPGTGIGVVEAPRGTLYHHYDSDENGLITRVNLIVATQNNSARMAMSVERAAKDLIHGGKADDGILNRVEMAFRAYDPCHACASHSLPGQMPLIARIRDSRGEIQQEFKR